MYHLVKTIHNLQMQAVFKSYKQNLFPIVILLTKHQNLLRIKESLETGSELPSKYIQEIYVS